MRKQNIFTSLILISAVVISCNSTSTNKEKEKKQQSDFNGIFEFQIDKTTIKSLDTLKYKANEVSIQSGITDMIKDKGISRVQDWELLCNGIRIFKVNDFNKGEIKFTGVSLTFYNDTLIKFSSNADYELYNVLTVKYPNYELVQKKSSVSGATCYYWYNGSIEATYYSFDDLGSSFDIQNEVKYWEIRNATEKAKEGFIKKEYNNL